MADDYLWDRKGEPDPDVEQLERALAPLRYRDRVYEVPPAAAQEIPLRRRFGRWTLSRWGRERPQTPARFASLVAVAAALVAATVVWRMPREQALVAEVSPHPPALPAAAFPVERLEGAPRVNAQPIEATARLGVGQWLETDPGSRARIAVADIGEVEVSGRSRVRLTSTGPAQHRLDLERGALAAKVNAPPRLFVVGTPAATAVDLGCAYTLEVDDDGRGLLRVTSGWVSLEDAGRTSLVPARASCETRRGKGPGTPSYEDAPRALRDALRRFDFESGGADAVAGVLDAARPRDALTVWHLLPRVDGALRTKVYERLRVLVPPPTGIGGDVVLRLDPSALERWRDAITGAGSAITW
jgi:hypothetical protein